MPRSTSKRPRKARKSFLHHAAGQVFGVAGITALSIFIICSFACTALLAGPALRSNEVAAVIISTLVDLTNQDRAQNQVDGLTVNPLLTEAAQAKANDMATKGYFAHVSPQGLTSWYWFKQAEYSFSYAGENLAVDFTDSDTVNQAWMNSPEHRANILNTHFTDIGIAQAQGVYEGQETTFIVEMFGAPATNAAEASDDVLDTISPTVATQMAFASTTVLGASASPTQATPSITHAISVANTTATPSNTQAAAAASAQTPPAYTPAWLSFLVASPQNLLRSIYIVLSALLLLALVIRTGFEFRKHHVRHVVAAFVLFVLMGGLLFAADHYIFVQPILGSAASASV